MARGITETTRGSAHYPAEQSFIAKRNATEEELGKAQDLYVGKIVNLNPQSDKQQPPPYRCAGVRLDSLKRLIFDLVKVDRSVDARQ